MKILAIEPYFGLSHKTFLEGYKRSSRHDVEIWSLPPRKWKWRMRGSAYHFAERAASLPQGERFDAVFVSDFLNLPDFLALAPRFRNVPAVVYFHENQITYPLGEHAPKKDYHYGWINLSTALSADRVFFNSYYHRDAFFAGVADVFDRMPDFVPTDLVAGLEEKSKILPVGIDFADHDGAIEAAPRRQSDVPTLLWNHRWEYDKGPDLFLNALLELDRSGREFRLVVCGQSFANKPEAFDELEQKLASRIDHFGYFPEQKDYLTAARQCDVIISTAVHEFFGVSVAEAIYLGCLPVLPKRLSYPEIIPPHLHPLFLYEDDAQLTNFLHRFLDDPPTSYRPELREAVSAFDWRNLASELDRHFDELT